MDVAERTSLQSAVAKLRSPWTITAWILLALGSIGVLGWVFSIPVLVQPLTSRPPLRPSAAVGLLALGIGALAMDRGYRRVAIAAASVAILIGFTALLDLATGLSLGTGSLPFGIGLASRLVLPASQALPLATAWGLLLGGVGLVAAAERLRTAAATFAVGVVGSTLVALSLALLLTQGIGFSPGVQFGPVVGSGPQVAIGLLALGVGLASSAWTRDWTPTSYPAWIPVAAGLASLTAVLFLWRAVIQGQRDDSAALLAAAAERTEAKVQDNLGRANVAVRRVASLSSGPSIGSEPWAHSVAGILASVPGMVSVAWVSSDRTRIELLPPPQDPLILRTQLGLQALSLGTPRLEAADSVRHFSLADSAQTLAIAVPRCDLMACDGFVIGLVRLDQLLSPIAGDSVDGYHRSVAWRGRTLVATAPPSTHPKELIHRSLVPLGDMSWELSVWPTGNNPELAFAGLSGLLLAFGLLVTGLLPVSLQLGRTLQANARTAELARLRLALGRSMDRAWSWEIPGRSELESKLESTGSDQEVRHGRWTDLIHPEDRRRVEALLAAHLDGRTPAFEAQYRLQDGDGGWRWRVDRGHVTERGPYGIPLKMLGVSGDVSERRRVEEERENSERRFRAAFDSAYQFQVLLDLDGRVVVANPTALALLGPGTTMESIQSTEFWQAHWWKTVDSREWARAACLKAREGSTVTRELEIASRDGQRIIMDFSLKPILNGQGSATQLLAEGRDMTARRRAESELREVETLTTMGRIAARVAHEINNPLAGIQNSFLLLRDAIPPTHPHFAYVGAIEREIGRIADVTRQLYETYRPETDGAGQTGVRTLIGDAVAFLEQVNRASKVRIQADLTGTASLVPIPESVLRQSVYNLVQNAVEASPPGGVVTVKAQTVGGTFILRVRDQGSGIPTEARQRVFEPFMTTKGSAVRTGGMGIGLSLVRRSVEAMGGSIEIVDPPGGGTEFVIRIPMVQAGNGGLA